MSTITKIEITFDDKKLVMNDPQSVVFGLTPEEVEDVTPNTKRVTKGSLSLTCAWPNPISDSPIWFGNA